jgi:SAM-dependent methyltransferase
MLYPAESQRRKVNRASDREPTLNHKFNFSLSKKYIIAKKVLDIGCWSGQFELLLKDTKAKIIGIDPSNDAITYAKKNIPYASFYVGIADKLPFKSGSFDTVLLFDVIEHVPKNTEIIVFKEIHRVLRKGGTLILSTPNNHIISILMDPAFFLIGHRHYSINTMVDMLRQSGYRTKKVHLAGGLYRLLCNNLDLLFKHILKAEFVMPKWIEKKVLKEYTSGGFAELHIIAVKK